MFTTKFYLIVRASKNKPPKRIYFKLKSENFENAQIVGLPGGRGESWRGD